MEIHKYKILPFEEMKYKSLLAKAINREDIEFIRVCRNSQKNILRQSRDISKKMQINYFEKIVWPQLALDQPSMILLSLFMKNKIIGYGGLVNISWDNKRAEISYIVNNDINENKISYKSCMNNFLCLIKKIAFINLSINRIYTETFDIRPEHISILENNGFQLEGRMKSHVIIDNKEIDSIIHGYLKSNYEK
tara:strand:+ start:486 stop:1064 length:579 start_codon:yes stop_codon:yes gene_type:complete